MKIVHKKFSYDGFDLLRNVYMFTANSTIRKNGALVMGAGVAKVVRDKYKGVDSEFGKNINHHSVFGVKFLKHENTFIGAFQTKVNWQEDSPLDVVKVSVHKLMCVAKARPHLTFHLPCPAINHGGKSVEEVLPLLESLPDNVIVYIDK